MKKIYTICLLLVVSVAAFAQTTETKVDSTASASIVADSLKLQGVPIDSATLAKKATETLKDSVANRLTMPELAVDTTLSDKVKEEGQARINQELKTDVPTDSAAIAAKAESIAAETIEKETDIALSGIPTDSAAIVNKARSATTERIQEETGLTLSGVPTDSAAVKSEVSSLAKEEFTNQTGIEAPDITLDSTTLDQAKEEVTKRAEEALKNTDEFKALDGSDSELGKLADMKEEIETTREQLQQMKAKKEMKQKMAASAKDFISNHSEQIQQVQTQMSELKEKYATVPNSNDLSTAQKRSSLKGETFWKRLVIGGNFNVTETNPVTIDFSPVLGWKFNKLFEVGVTGAYRAKFGADSNGINTFENEDVYGYSVYANHLAFKNFFGYLEAENISQVTGTAEDNKREWHQTLLVGIGRRFKVAKFLEMQAIVAYNFLHDNQDGVYNNPIVFKTGFRVLK